MMCLSMLGSYFLDLVFLAIFFNLSGKSKQGYIPSSGSIGLLSTLGLHIAKKESEINVLDSSNNVIAKICVGKQKDYFSFYVEPAALVFQALELGGHKIQLSKKSEGLL
jgi:hypothetical protein